jgi:hypothetical protein
MTRRVSRDHDHRTKRDTQRYGSPKTAAPICMIGCPRKTVMPFPDAIVMEPIKFAPFPSMIVKSVTMKILVPSFFIVASFVVATFIVASFVVATFIVASFVVATFIVASFVVASFVVASFVVMSLTLGGTRFVYFTCAVAMR